uniref:Macro domain-containing protein n=1 Tax=Corethron hystrix TaxID=216773 RepID=A0A7S1BLV8_9STRA|mmetsp:Transcript_33600/g.77513  ORF Transcript_33600/g.77513 Transcript_33600/m.77513 type:complete len:302 (+) Transcript_33600:81-986(+)
MSSKAWFKSAAPRLIRKFAVEGKLQQPRRSVEVWTTTCIVENFGKRRGRPKNAQCAGADCSVLINPANSSLSGPHDFPYFPKGGPVPKDQPLKEAHHIMGYVTQWGGMEVEGGMMFDALVVDGLVHKLGGMRLRAECKVKSFAAAARGSQHACPVGAAVVTGPGGKRLRNEYDSIVHTVPPFYAHHTEGGDAVDLLRGCYQSSLDLAFGKSATQTVKVGIPLLGAGCRGFPSDIALQVAGQESYRWMTNSSPIETMTSVSGLAESKDEYEYENVLAFGVLEDDIALSLINAIEESQAMVDE